MEPILKRRLTLTELVEDPTVTSIQMDRNVASHTQLAKMGMNNQCIIQKLTNLYGIAVDFMNIM